MPPVIVGGLVELRSRVRIPKSKSTEWNAMEVSIYTELGCNPQTSNFGARRGLLRRLGRTFRPTLESLSPDALVCPVVHVAILTLLVDTFLANNTQFRT